MIKTCILSCNNNKGYYSFFPVIYNINKKLFNINTVLFLISDSIPSILEEYKDNIYLVNKQIKLEKLLKKIKKKRNINISDICFIAKNLRFYVACLNIFPDDNDDDLIMISDIDSFIFKKDFYKNKIYKYIDEGNDNIITAKTSSCNMYSGGIINIARRKTFKKVFGINSFEDIYNSLIKQYNKYITYDNYYYSDQLMLYDMYNKFNKEIDIIVLKKIFGRTWKCGSRYSMKNIELMDNKNTWFYNFSRFTITDRNMIIKLNNYFDLNLSEKYLNYVKE